MRLALSRRGEREVVRRRRSDRTARADRRARVPLWSARGPRPRVRTLHARRPAHRGHGPRRRRDGHMPSCGRAPDGRSRRLCRHDAPRLARGLRAADDHEAGLRGVVRLDGARLVRGDGGRRRSGRLTGRGCRRGGSRRDGSRRSRLGRRGRRRRLRHRHGGRNGCRRGRRRRRGNGCGSRRGGGRRPGRQQGLRIEVAVLVGRPPDAEVDVGPVDLGCPAGADRADDRALGDLVSLRHLDRAEVEQRHGEAVGRLDRDGAAVRRQRPGEGDRAARRRGHGRAGVAGDVDAAVLPAGVGVVADGERPQDGAATGPGPCRRRRREQERGRRRREESASHRVVHLDSLSFL